MTANEVVPIQPGDSTVVVAADGSVTVTQVSNAVTVTSAGTITVPFSPLDLSPTLWLDASDTGTITESGGSVSQWDDKSTNGNNFVQATGSSQPATGTRTINSLNVVDFNGSTTFLENNPSTFAAAQPFTIFAVAEHDTDVYSRIFTQLGANVLFAFINTERTYSGAGLFVYGTTGDAPTGSPLLLRYTFDGASSNGFIDGVQTVSGNFGTNEFETGRVVRIGANESGVQALDGAVGEIFLVQGTLTAQQISDAETYLADKWGITL